MTTILIIAVLVAVVYVYATVVFYYGFKNWHPMCGGSCSREKGTGGAASCAHQVNRLKADD